METTILFGDNGKENGNYYLGFRVFCLPVTHHAGMKACC